MYIYMPITIITLRYIVSIYETTNILYMLKKICFILPLPPKPPFSHNTMESSVFQEVPMVNALIKRLDNKIKKGYIAKESEFFRIMFAIIPYYFRYHDNSTFLQKCVTITLLIVQVGVMVWLAQRMLIKVISITVFPYRLSCINVKQKTLYRDKSL